MGRDYAVSRAYTRWVHKKNNKIYRNKYLLEILDERNCKTTVSFP
jgi:hypothetical protein